MMSLQWSLYPNLSSDRDFTWSKYPTTTMGSVGFARESPWASLQGSTGNGHATLAAPSLQYPLTNHLDGLPDIQFAQLGQRRGRVCIYPWQPS